MEITTMPASQVRVAVNKIVRSAFAGASRESYAGDNLLRAEYGETELLDQYEKALHEIVTPAIVEGVRGLGVPCDGDFIHGDRRVHTIGAVGEGDSRRAIMTSGFEPGGLFEVRGAWEIAEQWSQHVAEWLEPLEGSREGGAMEDTATSYAEAAAAVKEIVRRKAFAWPIVENHWALSWESFASNAIMCEWDGKLWALDAYEKALHEIVTPAIVEGVRALGVPCDSEFVRVDNRLHMIGGVGEGESRRAIKTSGFDPEEEDFFTVAFEWDIERQWVRYVTDWLWLEGGVGR